MASGKFDYVINGFCFNEQQRPGKIKEKILYKTTTTTIIY